MKKRILTLTAVIALVFTLGFTLGCGHVIEPGNAAVTHPSAGDVEVAVAAVDAPDLTLETVGTVKAGTIAGVAAKIMGQVEQVSVDQGDRVKKGDVLAVIDRTQVEAGLRQAKAARAQAAAQAELARATYNRYQTLKERGSVSDQEYDQVKASYHQARAALGQASAAVASAQAMQEDAMVRAPFDGVISARLIEKGDLAAPGRPLFTLETEAGYRVDVAVPESAVSLVNPGETMSVQIDAIDGEPLTGTVLSVAPAADPGSRSFLVKVELPDHPQLKTGMFARVMVPLGKSDKIVVPATAVVKRGQLRALYLVDNDGVTHLRLVRVGRTLGDQVEVISGLHAGDRYVTGPSVTMKDGLKVSGVN